MMKTTRWSLGVAFTLLAPVGSLAVEAPPEVTLDHVKQIPPPGVMVPPADRAELEAGAEKLRTEIADLAKDPRSTDLLPDVWIYYNAVHYALKYDEFFDVGCVAKAKTFLKEGLSRAAELRDGKPTWPTATGLVVRGYVSRVDGSVQPYGLVIPPSFDTTTKHRLDLWYHGRGETLNEITFLAEREKSRGEFAPADAIVLHPYGRYCNGNRFAGEVDTFEAIDSVKKHYTIDDDRILVRGFSMGGGACWLMATHHASEWAAAAPGAGFSETAGFLHVTDLNAVPWYQRKMWALFDSTTMAVNLQNVPVVAYSGELDGQKQAADMMVNAAKDVGIQFPYVIGIGAHHNYTPAAKEELGKKLDALAAKGRDAMPRRVRFATYSLRYNTQSWVRIDALNHHWSAATVDAQWADDNTILVDTRNVAQFTLTMPAGHCPLDKSKPTQLVINGQKMLGLGLEADGSWTETFRQRSETENQFQAPQRAERAGGNVQPGADPSAAPQKVHGLQGPIDDAFMDSFIMVSPTGKPLSDIVGQWTRREEAHAIDAWRKQFRGEARVKDDAAVNDGDIAGNNLVLWGDPSSNAVLKKIADKLPVKWDADAIHVGEKTYASASHAPVLIYPNPLNPKHYVVLNSGFTFREYDYENNARQTPKLPDWAIVDLTTPPTAQTPGKIEAADFFDESWRLKHD